MKVYQLLAHFLVGFARGAAYLLHVCVFLYLWGGIGLAVAMVAGMVTEYYYEQAEDGVNGYENLRRFAISAAMLNVSLMVAIVTTSLSATIVYTCLFGVLLWGLNRMADHADKRVVRQYGEMVAL